MKHHRSRLVTTVCGLAVLVAGGLLTTGCTSAQPSTTLATATPSTPSLTYAARGSHAVGYRMFTTTGAKKQPLTLRSWYPARRHDKRPPMDLLQVQTEPVSAVPRRDTGLSWSRGSG